MKDLILKLQDALDSHPHTSLRSPTPWMSPFCKDASLRSPPYRKCSLRIPSISNKKEHLCSKRKQHWHFCQCCKIYAYTITEYPGVLTKNWCPYDLYTQESIPAIWCIFMFGILLWRILYTACIKVLVLIPLGLANIWLSIVFSIILFSLFVSILNPLFNVVIFYYFIDFLCHVICLGIAITFFQYSNNFL